MLWQQGTLHCTNQFNSSPYSMSRSNIFVATTSGLSSIWNALLYWRTLVVKCQCPVIHANLLFQHFTAKDLMCLKHPVVCISLWLMTAVFQCLPNQHRQNQSLVVLVNFHRRTFHSSISKSYQEAFNNVSFYTH